MDSEVVKSGLEGRGRLEMSEIECISCFNYVLTQQTLYYIT